ncbi:417_t:CDS:2, partial [Cetraspora pellucida]
AFDTADQGHRYERVGSVVCDQFHRGVLRGQAPHAPPARSAEPHFAGGGVAPACYSMSKLALIRFTEILAADHAGQGVVAATLHPGSVPTPGALELMPPSLHESKAAHPFGKNPANLISSLDGFPEYLSATWDMAELESRKDEIVEVPSKQSDSNACARSLGVVDIAGTDLDSARQAIALVLMMSLSTFAATAAAAAIDAPRRLASGRTQILEIKSRGRPNDRWVVGLFELVACGGVAAFGV